MTIDNIFIKNLMYKKKYEDLVSSMDDVIKCINITLENDSDILSEEALQLIADFKDVLVNLKTGYYDEKTD